MTLAAATMGIPAKTILGWDVLNWSQCLTTWAPYVSGGGLECLEIGCGQGGISLWLAMNGNHVVCSDWTSPRSEIREFHQLHDVADRIEYAAVDCTEMEYSERFDVIVLKSVLGGVWAQSGAAGFQRAIDGIHRALKPNGKLLFAENVRGSEIHAFARRYIKRRSSSIWIYPRTQEIVDSFSKFSHLQHMQTGLLGAFGLTEWQRGVLGLADRVLVPCVSERWRYICIGVATK